jgi:hypothetical protein
MHYRGPLAGLDPESGHGTRSVTPSSARSSAAIESHVSWRLQRAGDSAQCCLRTVGDRVELHITMTHDVVMSQQCRGPEEVSAISHAWWSALVERGWVEHESHVTLRAKRDRRSRTA